MRSSARWNFSVDLGHLGAATGDVGVDGAVGGLGVVFVQEPFPDPPDGVLLAGGIEQPCLRIVSTASRCTIGWGGVAALAAHRGRTVVRWT
jgi:hypothetical protein